MRVTRRTFCQTTGAAATAATLGRAIGFAAPMTSDLNHYPPILDANKLLRRWTFWNNRDWDWYAANIPLWECPHDQINEIYCYRAEVITKHLRYAAPETGYVFTEFSNADTLSWAGRYNAIASAADLHLEEVRWLKTKQYAEDYARYWMLTKGAQPRSYGFPVAWSTWQMGLVHGDQHVASTLLDEYVANYEGWEKGLAQYPHDHGFDPERQLFWNTGRDMGGEFNLASCQLSEGLRGIVGYKIRGGAGYRPDINAALFGEALTISELGRHAGRSDLANRFEEKAASLRKRTQTDLWNDEREFFLHRWRYDEYSEGDAEGHRSIGKWSWIWETNSDRNGGVGYKPQIAGKGHGRELTGYIPWRFRLPEDNEHYAAAWKFLTSPDFFYSIYGPTTAEQNDPWFHCVYHACRHNGQSWPFHTSRVLSAGAQLLNDYKHHGDFSPEKYFDLFEIYTKTHYKEGKPYLAEAHSPFEPIWMQDEWPGLDYFHSSYIDHVITGIAGLRPSDDGTLVVRPLAPATWDYFALDGVAYRNHMVSIVWDRTGGRYGIEQGLTVLVDGRVAATSPQLSALTIPLPAAPQSIKPHEVIVSANCEGAPFPKATASFTAKYDSPAAALNGLYWYDSEFGEKWTCRGSWTNEDWFEVDLGKVETVDKVRLFLYADEKEVSAPESYAVLYEGAGGWQPVEARSVRPRTPEANRANVISFVPVSTNKIRVAFRHKPGVGVGLAQLQVLRSPDAKHGRAAPA